MTEDKQFVCDVCGHIHDEKVDGKFDDLPKFYNCPECGSAKEEFKPI